MILKSVFGIVFGMKLEYIGEGLVEADWKSTGLYDEKNWDRRWKENGKDLKLGSIYNTLEQRICFKMY